MLISPTDDRKIASVTGATRGLGREISAQFARLGMVVLPVARDPNQGALVAAELPRTGAQAHSGVEPSDSDASGRRIEEAHNQGQRREP